MKKISRLMLGMTGALMLATSVASADSAGITLSEGRQFGAPTGEQLYASVCAACHMPSGEGATGAGVYPSLANNENLEEASYPVFVLINGLKGMPPVGRMMSDEQVAAVVNYIRTNFGNVYTTEVTAEEVAAHR
jgi:Cytochrome c, mono- and diheme variants